MSFIKLLPAAIPRGLRLHYVLCGGHLISVATDVYLPIGHPAQVAGGRVGVVLQLRLYSYW